jgi:hypothetical protein
VIKTAQRVAERLDAGTTRGNKTSKVRKFPSCASNTTASTRSSLRSAAP